MNGVQSKVSASRSSCADGDDLGLAPYDRLHPRKRYASQTVVLVGHDGVEAKVESMTGLARGASAAALTDSKLQTSNSTPRHQTPPY